MIKDVTYIINTHNGYSEPLKRLIASMSYIPSDRIIIVSADNPTTFVVNAWYGGVERHEPIMALHVDHNSFDYTGAIAMQDFGLETADHVFFLQDTMEFGMNTDYLIKKADPSVEATAVFGGQCNLVLYRADYLMSHTMWQFIQNQRNISKLSSIQYEGWLFHLSENKGSYPGTIHMQGIEYPYSNVPRMKEYYDGVDLVKYKANWGQNMHDLVVRP